MIVVADGFVVVFVVVNQLNFGFARCMLVRPIRDRFRFSHILVTRHYFVTVVRDVWHSLYAANFLYERLDVQFISR